MSIPPQLELLSKIIMLLCQHWNDNHSHETGLHFTIHCGNPMPKSSVNIKI